MNKNYFFVFAIIAAAAIAGYVFYPKSVPPKPERTILYWTDPMLPGDKSDHPGKSPMGMERVPVYADAAPTESSSTGDLKPGEYYTCPMHPAVHLYKPGTCPICGMTLVKKTSAGTLTEKDKNDLATVAISPSKQVLGNVQTAVVKTMSLEKDIHAVGTIEYAEPNFRHISTRFPGRLDKLYLTYTGQLVHKGDPVADVYSPDAISAQKEYLLAKDSYEEVKDAADIISGGALSLLDQSRQKLLRWGFTANQIADLESTKEVKNTITIHSEISGTVLKKSVDPQHYAAEGEDMYDVADLSTVWMVADIYEYEVGNIKTGQNVQTTIDAFPGKTFPGKVVFISPSIDPSSRTVKVRLELPNPHLDLKIGMYANAGIHIPLLPSVAVPVTAVLSSGDRTIIWAQKSEGVFTPIVVTLGERAGDYYQVLSGLREGTTIAVSGGYLLDSESRLESANQR